MKKELTEFEKAMNDEIERRISVLEQEGYGDIKRFNRTDFIFVCIAVVVGLGIITLGLL